MLECAWANSVAALNSTLMRRSVEPRRTQTKRPDATSHFLKLKQSVGGKPAYIEDVNGIHSFDASATQKQAAPVKGFVAFPACSEHIVKIEGQSKQQAEANLVEGRPRPPSRRMARSTSLLQ
jgi:hypothetical protein